MEEISGRPMGRRAIVEELPTGDQRKEVTAIDPGRIADDDPSRVTVLKDS
jgi:hypothetical protein